MAIGEKHVFRIKFGACAPGEVALRVVTWLVAATDLTEALKKLETNTNGHWHSLQIMSTEDLGVLMIP